MEIPSIEERLSRLERQNRRLRMWLLAVIVLAGGAMWLSAARRVLAQAPAWKRTVEAEKFVLRDVSGKQRAVLTMVDGDPSLALLDATGQLRVGLGTFSDTPGLAVYNANGRPVVALGTSGDAPALALFDPSGTPRVELNVASNGAGLTVYDASAKKRIALYTDTGGGNPGLSLFDGNGSPRVGLSLFEDIPVLALFDASRKMRAELDGSADRPSLALQDSAGFKSVIGHVALQTPATGEQSQSSAASIHLFNKAGNVIWAAP